MADIDAKAKELAELDVNSTLNLARRLRGLAVDCENTDGWEAPASDVYQAAALILSQAETIAELRKALNLIDALDPEQRVYGCSSDALRGLVIQMGQYARTALARAAKEGQDA